jgi:catechol 2,3-dioxygenase-like lactoylglutathione lyase family enzyme
MIDHIEVPVRDSALAAELYRKALAPLGYAVYVVAPPLHGLGNAPDQLDLWLRAVETAAPQHFAFRCATRELVAAVHRAAVDAGAVDTGAPAVLERISPTYYAAFVRDPDGHHVEFVCHARP